MDKGFTRIPDICLHQEMNFIAITHVFLWAQTTTDFWRTGIELTSYYTIYSKEILLNLRVILCLGEAKCPQSQRIIVGMLWSMRPCVLPSSFGLRVCRVFHYNITPQLSPAYSGPLNYGEPQVTNRKLSPLSSSDKSVTQAASVSDLSLYWCILRISSANSWIQT